MKNSIEIPSHVTGFGYLQLKQLLATLILSLVISPSVVNAGIYKWTDENGKIHYGSQRPKDAPAERMKLHIPEPASQPEAQQDAEEGDQQGDQKKEAPLKDDGDQEKANKERAAYCANERKRLQTLVKNKEVYEKDTSGKVNKVSSDARNQRLSKIKANIDKYCK